jgi:hypothetical protein
MNTRTSPRVEVLSEIIRIQEIRLDINAKDIAPDVDTVIVLINTTRGYRKVSIPARELQTMLDMDLSNY